MVSALSICTVFCAFVAVFCVCLENVYLGSNVIPRIFGSLFVGICVLFMLRVRLVLYSAGSGVKSVAVVFEAFSVSWLSCVHVCI